MRIGIEAQRIFRPQKYGMDIAAIELIRNLQQIDTDNEYIIFVNPDTDVCIEETKNFRIWKIINSVYPVWEQWYLPKAIRQAKLDLIHCTSNTAPLRLHIPLVLTLHDVISLEPSAKYSMSIYQEMGRIYRKWIIPKVLSKCQHVITVSYSEKQKIYRKMTIPEDKMSVIYNGVDEKFGLQDKLSIERVRSKYHLPEHYISFIGNTDPRKNIHNVLLAYSVYIKHSIRKMPLVILHYNESQLKRLLNQLKIPYLKNYIHILGYLDTWDMPAFYAASDMFLFPSLREGFGMPVLEAMACGTPVITSNTSSMPEVAENAALFVDPFDVDDIALNMLYLENHPEQAGELREKGLVRANAFSWKKMASQVLGIYTSVMKQNVSQCV